MSPLLNATRREEITVGIVQQYCSHVGHQKTKIDFAFPNDAGNCSSVTMEGPAHFGSWYCCVTSGVAFSGTANTDGSIESRLSGPTQFMTEEVQMAARIWCTNPSCWRE
jgi:hypothetical protein